ncbi:MAG: hypothetical protein ACP5F6_06215 [Microbacter sp.]
MKRFLVSNAFALVLFVTAVVAVLTVHVDKGSLSFLMITLAIMVLLFASLRLLKLEKEEKIEPVINFDKHCIEDRNSGKVLYQFTSTEWTRLTLDEKYNMLRMFTLA